MSPNAAAAIALSGEVASVFNDARDRALRVAKRRHLTADREFLPLNTNDIVTDLEHRPRINVPVCLSAAQFLEIYEPRDA